MSSSISRGSRTEVSVSWIVIRAGFSSPIPIHLNTVHNMRLILSPKSHIAFLMDIFLIMQDMMNFSGSFNLSGSVPFRIALQFRFN
jgi:hypothetical protein